jgi:hypothetical protein
MRAALIYQKATSEADRLIADRLSALMTDQPAPPIEREDDEPDDGSTGVLVPA